MDYLIDGYSSELSEDDSSGLMHALCNRMSSSHNLFTKCKPVQSGPAFNFNTKSICPSVPASVPTPVQTSVRVPLRSLPRRHLIIFDWDDTLFPTHALQTFETSIHNNDTPTSQQQQQEQEQNKLLQELTAFASVLCALFRQMIKLYGAENIVIITNATCNWIHKCLNVDVYGTIFSEFEHILITHCVETTSASTAAIRRRYPDDAYKWKEFVFGEYLARHFGSSQHAQKGHINCITSIGDSLFEYRASARASRDLCNRILCRIRLKRRPTVSDLTVQLRGMLKMLPTLANCSTDIEIDHAYLRSRIVHSGTDE